MAVLTPKASAESFTAGLVVHFVTSVQEVFSTMLATAVTVGTPFRKNDPVPQYDVSAVIGFSGNIVGSMVLCFDRATALRVVQALSGAPVMDDSQDFADAIGELGNMVAGAAKKHFNTVASISLPSVIVGHGHSVARMHDVPSIIIPCATPLGSFGIEVSIKTVALPT
jgi:chemotaxis protein CheX